MNLKLIGPTLVNFDALAHITFGKAADDDFGDASGRKALKATLRFVDGSERVLDDSQASALLDWVKKTAGSDVEVIFSSPEAI